MVNELCNKRVFPIGLGTWGIGGGYWRRDESRDKEWVEAIRYALGKGINVIDTAEMYGDGHAEELVGRAIGELDREKLVIITKVWPNHLEPSKLKASAKASLRRLGVKYVDLLLIHWPNPSVPLKESVRAMEELVDEGVVYCIGVSNFEGELFEEAIYSVSKYEIEANEVLYNVLERRAERTVLPIAEKNGVKVIAYSPLAQGRVFADGRVKSLAERLGVTPTNLALAYLIPRAVPIPKAERKEHIDDIVRSANVTLPEWAFKEVSSWK
ncbi:MAG: aldo/keto reductase [Sulfolobales archaeon]|nr:aldo/keto reductase [Sulfolobales archaeon]